MKHTLLLSLLLLVSWTTWAQTEERLSNSPRPVGPVAAIIQQTPTRSARQAAAATIRYVKAGAAGAGTSWANASGDLQAMINASAFGDQVWVAGGTYKPNTSGLTDARAARFTLNEGVDVLGGFAGAAGSEGNVSARTASPSSTTLSGDLGTPGEQADNAYHVVYAGTSAATFDGFCVTAGNANGSTVETQRGGGLFISGNLSLVNCLVTGNTATDLGGGIYMQLATSGSWENCQITNNTAPQGNASGGGGMLLQCTNYQLRNCQFTANQTSFLGGGLYISASTPIQLVSCVFDQNAATAFGGFGGGLHITNTSNATIVNSFFTRNRGNYGGALLTNSGSVATCINTTIRANTSGIAGGAVYSLNDGRINLTNSVLWDNGGSNATAGFNNYFSYTLTPPVPFNYHDQGGNIIATFDPFESSSGPALKACAPAIDAGSDAANTTTTDLLGNARKVRTIDMGAAEFRRTPYTLSVTAQATPSAVCVGNSTRLQATPIGSPNTPYTYTWATPGGATLSSTSSNPVTATLTSAGTPSFGISVTDALGCLATASVSVTANALPTQYNVTGGGNYCAGESGLVVGLSGSQTGVAYQLQRDGNVVGSPVAGTGGALSFGSQTTAGRYTVQATNASTACQQAMTGSASVTVNNPPTPSLTNNGPLSCTMTTVTLTATGGSSYTFTDGNSQELTGSGTTRSVSSPGVYAVRVANEAGCTSTTTTSVASNTVVVTAALSANPSTTLTCSQPTLRLTASGGDLYRFSANVASQSGNQATVNVAGTYSVTVTSTATGCFSTTNIAISQDVVTPTPSLTTATGSSSFCANSSLTLVAGGGVSYRFSSGATQIGGSNGNTATVSTAGTYSVVVTGANGCTATASASVNTVAVTTLTSVPPTSVSVCETAPVSLSVGASGVNLRYQWYKNSALLSGQTTPTLSIPSASSTDNGSYYVMVTGVCGTTSTNPTILTVRPRPAAPTLAATSFTAVAGTTPLPLTPFVATTSNTLSFSGVNGVLTPPVADISTAGVQSFSVTATNAFGCVSVSTPFSLTVYLPLPPASQRVCRGSAAVLTVFSTAQRYQWYRVNGTALLRLTDVTGVQRGTGTASLTLLSVQTSASYVCQATMPNGSVVSYGPYEAVVTLCGGRQAAGEEPTVALSIVVAPNPSVGGWLRATVRGASGEPLRASLYDQQGRLWRQALIERAGGEQVVEWSVSDVPVGVLLLRASTDRQSQTVKVIHE